MPTFLAFTLPGATILSAFSGVWIYFLFSIVRMIRPHVVHPSQYDMKWAIVSAVGIFIEGLILFHFIPRMHRRVQPQFLNVIAINVLKRKKEDRDTGRLSQRKRLVEY